MSESHLYSDVYIQDDDKRNAFIEAVSVESELLQLGDDELSILRCDIGEVIYIYGMGGGYDDIDKSYLKWLKTFSPDVATVSVVWDGYRKDFGVQGKRKIGYKKALDALLGVSKRVETGLMMGRSEEEIMAYLESNEVDPLELFQGKRHIDRLAEDRTLGPIEYFIDKGLDPDISVTDYTTVTPSENFLIHLIIFDEALVKKFVERGADVSLVSESGWNLLHWADFDSIDLVKYLIDVGVDIHHQNDARQTPLMSVVESYLDDSDESEEELETDFFPIVNAYLDAGADPCLLDARGAGIYLYCRHYPKVQQWFLDRYPKMPSHDSELELEEVVTRLFNWGRDNIKFYEQCLDEGVFSPFFDDRFVEMLRKTPFDKTPEEETSSALSRLRALLVQVVKLDRVDILTHMESLGFPILMGLSPGTTYSHAQKNSSAAIVKYMEEQGVSDELINSQLEKLFKFIEKARAELAPDMDYPKFCSDAWIAKKKEHWERFKNDPNSYESNRSLGESLRVRLKRFLSTSPKKLEDLFLGHEILIDSHYGDAALIEGDDVILTTADEVYRALYEKTALSIT